MIDYNIVRLKNGLRQAVSQALADIAIAGLETRIDSYKRGMITAEEFLDYLQTSTNQAQGV